jgi:hypothetical protein
MIPSGRGLRAKRAAFYSQGEAFLLIPAGAVLFGRCDAQVQFANHADFRHRPVAGRDTAWAGDRLYQQAQATTSPAFRQQPFQLQSTGGTAG